MHGAEGTNSLTRAMSDSARRPQYGTVHRATWRGEEVAVKRIKLPEKDSLYFFVNGRYVLKGDTLMSEVYEKRQD